MRRNRWWKKSPPVNRNINTIEGELMTWGRLCELFLYLSANSIRSPLASPRSPHNYPILRANSWQWQQFLSPWHYSCLTLSLVFFHRMGWPRHIYIHIPMIGRDTVKPMKDVQMKEHKRSPQIQNIWKNLPENQLNTPRLKSHTIFSMSLKHFFFYNS